MRTRAIARAAGAVALAAVTVALVTSPAHAAAYRYWTYWQAPVGASAWAFATEGAGTSVPVDGDVEGWSFGVTTESGNLDDAPAAAPDFATICGDTVTAAGQKRVALVVDTGVAALAPAGQQPPPPIVACVTAPEDATGYDVLRSMTEVRVENGLVCGIGGYPTGECAPVLDDAQAQALLTAASAEAPAAGSPTEGATPESTSAMEAAAADPPTSGPGTPLATLAVGLLLIGALVFWYLRGRSDR